MKLTASALIIIALLSIVAGISVRMNAQQPLASSISVDLKFVFSQKSTKAFVDIKLSGDSAMAFSKMLGSSKKPESLLSERLKVSSEFVSFSFKGGEASVSLKLTGHSPPCDGIDFVVQEDMASTIALLLEKIGLTGVSTNLSITFVLPKGAEVKELKISPEDAFNVSIEGSKVVITSKAPMVPKKGFFSLYLRYSNPEAKRKPGE